MRPESNCIESVSKLQDTRENGATTLAPKLETSETQCDSLHFLMKRNDAKNEQRDNTSIDKVQVTQDC